MALRLDDRLLGDLLELPYEDRRQLVERLVESLHPDGENVTNDEWRSAWLAEWQRRIERADEGIAARIPLDEAWPEISGDHA